MGASRVVKHPWRGRRPVFATAPASMARESAKRRTRPPAELIPHSMDPMIGVLGGPTVPTTQRSGGLLGLACDWKRVGARALSLSLRPFVKPAVHAQPRAVVVKGGSHASPILLDSQVRSDCGSIRKHVRFAGFCG